MLKTVTFWLEFTLYFLKNALHKTCKTFNRKFGLQYKDRKSSYQVRQILALFCKSVALTLGQNCVKSLRITEIVKQIKFKWAWGEFEAKN